MHIMRRHSRQGHLTSRLERIERASSVVQKAVQRRMPHRIARRLSIQSRRALIAQYESGASIKGLAKRFAISEYSVREVLVASGSKPCSTAVTSVQIDQIVEMRQKAQSLDTIAKAAGVSVGTVRIVLAARR